MEITFMNLKILLPFQVYADKGDVKRIVAETPQGSFGILPQRLDCAAALAPGILTYESESDVEVILAIDEGILVKAGKDVFISVRNAIGGANLGQLHEAVNSEFMNIDEREKNVRSIMGKLEIGFIRRLDEFRKK
jgi:F-type H+-transporting ATPase subunit epsilon